MDSHGYFLFVSVMWHFAQVALVSTSVLTVFYRISHGESEIIVLVKLVASQCRRVNTRSARESDVSTMKPVLQLSFTGRFHN